ncbi:MAG: hypothetical protein ACLQVX_09845 [Limisphaerales bacterium]
MGPGSFQAGIATEAIVELDDGPADAILAAMTNRLPGIFLAGVFAIPFAPPAGAAVARLEALLNGTAMNIGLGDLKVVNE